MGAGISKNSSVAGTSMPGEPGDNSGHNASRGKLLDHTYSSRRGLVAKRQTIAKRYLRIADEYTSLEQVTEALRHGGLESSNLILAIDFTKSNEWTGQRSFNRKSLHDIGDGLNPYEQAISILGRTLSAFDDDNLIPCYGFGDVTTYDRNIFSFNQDDKFCNGFEDVLMRYRAIVPELNLSGPTSFAPAIEMAMTIVEQSGGQYHVLVIIADGQVTKSPRGLSEQEFLTVKALVEASKYPLSIILVGVGDGPWDTMEEFDDNIPSRDFDNFQFVNFTKILSKNVPVAVKEAEFALAALMEIPSQYKATIELNLLGRKTKNSPNRKPLPPPSKLLSHSNGNRGQSSSSTEPKPLTYPKEMWKYVRPPEARSSSSSGHRSPAIVEDMTKRARSPQHHTDTSSSSTNSSFNDSICPICLTKPKNMAFRCGHQTCCDCGEYLNTCPMCRKPITDRIKLY